MQYFRVYNKCYDILICTLCYKCAFSHTDAFLIDVISETIKAVTLKTAHSVGTH